MARNLVAVITPYNTRPGITVTENKQFLKNVMKMFLNAGVAPVAPLQACSPYLQLTRERERFLTLGICKSLVSASNAIAFVLRPRDMDLGGFDSEMKDLWDWMMETNKQSPLKRSSIYLCDQAGTLIHSARLDYADPKPWNTVRFD